MMRSDRMALLAVLVLAGAALMASGCGNEEHADPRGAAFQVRTAVLSPVEESGTVEIVGSLRASQEAVIAGKVMGTVTEIAKNAGDPVKRGEILIRIDSQDVVGQIAQAQGALSQATAAAVLAETNYKRFQELQEKNAASQMELDQARYQYETTKGAVAQAEGAVATARSYQDYAAIPAPFSGRVVDRLCEVGDLAVPGRPLIRIEDAEQLRLHAHIEAARAGAAVPGAEVEVQVPALGDRRFRGTIEEVVPAADPATHSLLVKIDLEQDPALRSGLYGKAYLPVGKRTALRVPRTAVMERGGVRGVFVADNGKAAFRMITLAEEGGPTPEVLSGLSQGDTIILSPPAGLQVGSPIEVTQ